MVCSAAGNPQPNIFAWEQDNKITDHTINTVVYDNVSRDNAGYYTCIANNGLSPDGRSEDTPLVVHYAAQISNKDEKQVGVEDGDDVTLVCIADALPSPAFTWLNPNGTELTNGTDRVTITSETMKEDGVHGTEIKSMLSIAAIDSDKDYGGYTCIANNNIGSQDMFLIYVNGTTVPNAVNNLGMENTTVSTIEISWSPGYAGGNNLDQTFYVAYRKKTSNDEWIEEESVAENYHVIRGLQQDTTYEIRVVAENRIGRGSAAFTEATTNDLGPLLLTKVTAKNPGPLVYETSTVSFLFDHRMFIITVLPDPVSNVMILNDFIASSSLTVEWVPGDNKNTIQWFLTDYRETTENIGFTGQPKKITDGNMDTVEDLTPGTEYEIIVYSASIHGINLNGMTVLGRTSDLIDPNGQQDLGLIIGGAIGAVVLLIIIAIVIYLIRRPQKNNTDCELDTQSTKVQLTGTARASANETRQHGGRDNSGLIETNLNARVEEPYVNYFSKQFVFPRENLHIRNELGHGEFGKVLLGIAAGIVSGEKKTKVAIKTLKDDANDEAKLQLIKEFNLLKSLMPALINQKNGNVVQLLGGCMDEDPLYMILEYMQNGNLKTLLRESRTIGDGTYGNLFAGSKSFTPTQLMRFAHQVANGMAFLARQKCIHRDLAARNVLLNESFECKVSDFGLAEDVMNGEVYRRQNECRLPIRWMAIESILGDVHTTESDVWSFGVLLWEIVTLGSRPYPKLKGNDIRTLLKNGQRMPRPKHCSEQLYNIMLACWEKEPSERPLFEQLMKLLDEILEGQNNIKTSMLFRKTPHETILKRTFRSNKLCGQIFLTNKRVAASIFLYFTLQSVARSQVINSSVTSEGGNDILHGRPVKLKCEYVAYDLEQGDGVVGMSWAMNEPPCNNQNAIASWIYPPNTDVDYLCEAYQPPGYIMTYEHGLLAGSTNFTIATADISKDNRRFTCNLATQYIAKGESIDIRVNKLASSVTLSTSSQHVNGSLVAVISDQEQTWICVASGSTPSSTMIWTLDGVTSLEWPSNDKERSEVSITPQWSNHNNVFQCRATVPADEIGVFTSVILDVKVPPADSNVKLSDSRQPSGYPDDVVVSLDQGEDHSFTCEVENTRPAARIRWYIGTSEMTEGITGPPSPAEEDNLVDHSSTLTFTVNVNQHRRYLECRADIDINGAPSPIIRRVQLDVYYPPAIISVKAEPSNPVISGSTITLTCTADGNPTPTLEWMKDDLPISSSGGTLELIGIDIMDAGYYICIASNGRGQIDTSDVLAVAVHYSAEIINSDNQVNVDKGNNGTLFSSVIGNPTPVVIWYDRDGVVIDSDRNDMIINTVNHGNGEVNGTLLISSLTIVNVLPETHHGDYTCKGSNSLGSVLSTISLQGLVIPKQQTTNIGGIIGGVLAVVMGVVVIVLVTLNFLKRSRKDSTDRQAVRDKTLPTVKTGAECERLEQDNNAFEETSFTHESNNTVYSNVSQNQYVFPRENLHIFKELGRGEFGQVFLAKATMILPGQNESTVAVKTVKESAGLDAKQQLVKEFEVMKLLMAPLDIQRNTNIVRLLGGCLEKDPLYIIVEYMENGDLKTLLRKSRGVGNDTYDNLFAGSKSFTSAQLITFAREVANGMAFLAQQKCIHRDLAARNVLLNSKYQCKVSDFGLAQDVMNVEVYRRKNECLLPIRWMAIESLLGNTHSIESDVWSFGVLLWEIITLGARPYPQMKGGEIRRLLKAGYRMPRPKHCNEELYSIMLECWDKELAKRPSFEKLINLLYDILGGEAGYLSLSDMEPKLYEDVSIPAPDEKV
ncbi:uncharacterized protein [Amphiura filiformis]|uniref:uncharacterized protein n=1 Tax=Amphiura filiformis TaxID=82378 RepID=UPI003B225E44